jgi:hypothetical protein
MDVSAVLALILKGVGVVSTLVAIGQDVAPAIKVITNLITGAQAGTVTDEELASTEATLDAMIVDFNQPMEG